MSRSAKHTPWRKRQHIPEGFLPIHDHRFGPCDISERPPSDATNRCHWKEATAPVDVLAPLPASSPARSLRHQAHALAHGLTRSLAVGLDPDEVD
jgi:hypothetical protein